MWTFRTASPRLGKSTKLNVFHDILLKKVIKTTLFWFGGIPRSSAGGPPCPPGWREPCYNPKTIQPTQGYILTIWNSLKLVLGLLKKISEMFCFFHIVKQCEASIQGSSNLTRIMLRLFGVVSTNLVLVVNIFRQKFCVFQIASYQLN